MRSLRKLSTVAVIFVFQALLWHPASFAQQQPTLSPAQVQKEKTVYEGLKQAKQMMQDKQLVEARKLMQGLVQYDPTANSGNLHSMLGLCDQDLGNLRGAIAEDQLAIVFEPKMVDLNWNIALAYKDLGDYESAKQAMQLYLENGDHTQLRRDEAQGFLQKMNEQERLNGGEQVNGPDYLGSLTRQQMAGRWPSNRFPLKVHIENSDHVNGAPENASDVLMNAFAAWNSAANGALPVTLTNSRGHADIVIRWTANPDEVHAHDGVHLEQGVTLVRELKRQGVPIAMVDHADMTLLTVNRETHESIPLDEMKTVCLHEIGHAFGLVGHSPNSADTMYFATSARQLPALSKRDKVTICMLYGLSLPPNLVPPGMASMPRNPMVYRAQRPILNPYQPQGQPTQASYYQNNSSTANFNGPKQWNSLPMNNQNSTSYGGNFANNNFNNNNGSYNSSNYSSNYNNSGNYSNSGNYNNSTNSNNNGSYNPNSYGNNSGNSYSNAQPSYGNAPQSYNGPSQTYRNAPPPNQFNGGSSYAPSYTMVPRGSGYESVPVYTNSGTTGGGNYSNQH